MLKEYLSEMVYMELQFGLRGDLIAFTKLHKGKFYIGVMRTDGSGERLLTGYQEAPSGRLMDEFSFFMAKTDDKERVFLQNCGL